ncbi:MAG: hypothetical protein J2P17_31755 [Mycobacterium sp.]|nr:hypothetical protein [Mycobacterium sp.]
MSVFVSDFGDGTVWTVTHDDAGHSGSIDPTTVQHPLRPDGTPDHNFALVVCPVCGAVSTHPVGGGAQPESVQRMFVIACQTSGCPCGQVAADDADAIGESHVRLQVNRQDGPGRWKLG